MLFMSSDHHFPSKSGGVGWVDHLIHDYPLGTYALLRTGFSLRQASLLWKITQRKFNHT